MLAKIRLVFIILLLAGIIAGAFLVFREAQKIIDSQSGAGLPPENSVKPWVEVISPRAFELEGIGRAVKKELFTGDELLAGAAVRVEEGGFINVYFPDGSIARVDGGTEFGIEESSYDNGSGKLVVKINLVLGRIWSKIISLATPDSVWEVKTSTAVATVRGTAFGMEYGGGKSTVIGSENQVAVSAIDPKTKKVLKEAEVLVEAGKSVEIKKELAEQIVSHVAKMEAQKETAVSAPAVPAAAPAISAAPIIAVKEAPAEILKQDWVKNAVEADRKINEKIKEIKEVKKEIPEIRKEIRKAIRGDVIERAAESKPEKNDLLNSYKTYEEKPTKENLRDLILEVKENIPEKLPTEIIDNLPKVLPYLPKEIQPVVEKALENPEALKNELMQKWEAITNE